MVIETEKELTNKEINILFIEKVLKLKPIIKDNQIFVFSRDQLSNVTGIFGLVLVDINNNLDLVLKYLNIIGHWNYNSENKICTIWTKDQDFDAPRMIFTGKGNNLAEAGALALIDFCR